nr:NAD(+)/NADH kinase [Maliibacterium massiliense]
MVIGIYTYASTSASYQTLHALLDALQSRGLQVLLQQQLADIARRPQLATDEQALFAQSEMLLVLGGDGTLLGAARKAAEAGLPILGVNMGRLGFLSEIEFEELGGALDQVLSGDYTIEKRMMLSCYIDEVYKGIALNDVVISRNSISRIITVGVAINDQPVNAYRADGLIVATPTGSTAYSLSAGGPILSPALECLLISPICPHTLHSRSVVVGPKEEITLTISDPRDETILTLDGQMAFPLRNGMRVKVRRARAYARFVRLNRKNFYHVLNHKLSDWNGDSDSAQ